MQCGEFLLAFRRLARTIPPFSSILGTRSCGEGRGASSFLFARASALNFFDNDI